MSDDFLPWDAFTVKPVSTQVADKLLTEPPPGVRLSEATGNTRSYDPPWRIIFATCVYIRRPVANYFNLGDLYAPT